MFVRLLCIAGFILFGSCLRPLMAAEAEENIVEKSYGNYPYDEVKPSELPPSEGKILNSPEQPSLVYSSRDDKILVRKLNGLYFYDDPCKLSGPDKYNSGLFAINFELPEIDALGERLQSFMGRPITLNVLKRIQEETVNFFREEGYSLVSVVIPPGQDISKGYVKIVILFGRLGKVTAEGARFFSNTKLAAEVRTKKGQVISSAKMLEDLNWLNNNPFRTVDLYYQPGDEVGETDVLLKVKDKVPLRAFVGYQHTGYEIAGPSRWFMGLNWGRVFGLDDQFNTQFTCASSIDQWWAVSGNYILPLPWRHFLKAYGNFVYSRTNQLTDSFRQHGKGWYVGGRYDIPLPAIQKLVHDVSIGYDFKRTNNFLSISANLIYNNYSDISEFLLKYAGTAPDALGSNSFSMALVWSPGHMTRYNTNRDFEAQRSGAKPNYLYGQLSYDRATGLPFGFSWSFSFFGQVASGKLLPAEELSIGGQYTVRGYKENAVVGDHGFFIKNELRTPGVEIFFRRKSKEKQIKDEAQFLIFVDIGWAAQVDRNVVDCSTVALASVGPGVRYRINDFLDLRFDYGVQLANNKDRVVGNGREGRGHFALQLSY